MLVWTLEGHIAGDTVEELAADALDSDLNYLAFSDHSYCIDSSEFNQVQNDCEVVDDDEQNYPNFTCLMGEELSTQDILGEPNFILSGNSKSSREFYKFYIILGRNVIVNRK